MLSMADKKLKEAIELRKGYQLALRQAPREQARGFREVRALHSASSIARGFSNFVLCMDEEIR